MAKVSRPILYTGLLAVVVAAFVLTSEEPKSTSSSRKRKPKTSVTKQGVVYLAEDYEANEPGAQFAPFAGTMRNAFRPLVARTEGSSLVADFDMGGVPASLVGEPGWAYTGMAEIDGVPQALVENSRTGDGLFLKQGQSWKGTTVHRISPEQLVLMSKTGVAKTVAVDSPESGVIGGPGGFQPVVPPISGAIGRNLAVQPTPQRSNVARRNGSRNSPNGQEGIGVADEN